MYSCCDLMPKRTDQQLIHPVEWTKHSCDLMPKRTDQQYASTYICNILSCDLMPKRTDQQFITTCHPNVVCCDLMPKRTDQQYLSLEYYLNPVVIWCQNGLTNNTPIKVQMINGLWFDAKTDWPTISAFNYRPYPELWFDAKTDWPTINL